MESKRRRAALHRMRVKRSLGLLALAIIGFLIASSVLAFNAGEMYLAGKDNTSVYVPEVFVSRAETGMMVMATDPRGIPIQGRDVTVDLVTNEGTETVFSGTTGQDGVVQPAFPVDAPPGEVTVVIRTGKTVLTKRVPVDTTTRIYLSTDKPVYQPGQVVHLRTLTFRGSAAMASTEPVTVSVQSPDGDRILRRELQPDSFGIAAMDYPLSPILPTGAYRIEARVGEETAEKSVTVKPYVLPRFRITYEGVKGWYTMGEAVSGRVRVEYFFGEVVKGAAVVELKAYTGTWETLAAATGNLINGRLSFAFDPLSYAVGSQANGGNGYIELNATVTDESGHEETKSLLMPVAQYPIEISVLSDVNIAGTDSTFTAIVRYPDGTPVSGAAVTYGFPHGGGSATADSRGVAQFAFHYEGQQEMRITASDGTDYGWVTLPLSGGTEGVKVISDRSDYAVGDTASFTIAFRGTTYTDWAYYDVMARGFVVTTGRVMLAGGSGSFDLPVTADLAPRAEVRVFKTGTDMEVYRDTVVIGVGEETALDVSIQADGPTYRPGEDVALTFQVTEEGVPRVAALGVSIVDQAVFEVGERFQGLEAAYLGLEEEFVQPQALILDYLYGSGAPLPADFPLEVRKESIGEASMVSTYPLHVQRAEEYREASIGGLGMTFLLGAVLGYFGLVVLSFRYRELMPVAVVMIMLLPIALLVHGMTSTLTGPVGPRAGGATSGQTTFDSGDDTTAAAGTSFDIFDLSGPAETGGGSGSPAADAIAVPARVRTFFPETWYWNPSIITDSSGTASVSIVAPDSITSWSVEAVGSTRDAKFGLGSENVTVFQEFFVEPDIPLGAVVGDQFPLRASVFNYLNQTMDVSVTLANDTWFVLQNDARKNVTVPAKSVREVEFLITAKEWGAHKVSILAGNSQISDAVVRDVVVEPGGPWRDRLVNGELQDGESVNVTLDLNAARIPGTETAYVKLQGGMESVLLDGAENYIVFVSGCGEQSTSKLSVNIAAYRHLMDGGGADVQLSEYETKIVQGIQHELTFLVDAPEGRAISWFGDGPDLWLTSWALFAFKDLVDAGFGIDERLIADLQSYVVGTQAADGSFSFPDVGHWSINSELQNLKETATAYIVRALSYSGYPQDSAVRKAVAFLEERVGPQDSPFTVALTLAALARGGGSAGLMADLAASLEASAKDGGDGTAYWEYEQGGNQDYYYGTNVIETTGYAVIALTLSRRNPGLASGGVGYILTRRDQGRWGSTHDTAVAFQALSLAGDMAIDDITADVSVNGVLVGSARFTRDTEDLTALVDLTPSLQEANVVTLESRGSGTLLYQVYLKEAMPWPADPGPSQDLYLRVTYDTTSVRVDDLITATVQLRYDGPREQLKMVLVDLRSPVGFCFEAGDLDDLVDAGVADWYELLGCREARVYVTDLPRGELLTFEYRLVAKLPIRATVQNVNAFDMYDPAVKTTLGPVVITATQ